MTDQVKEEVTKESAQTRLNALLGFDSTKKSAGGDSMLSEALAEIKEERAKQNKVKALELLKKAVEISEKMEAAKKEFQVAINKSEKELSQIITSIEQIGK